MIVNNINDLLDFNEGLTPGFFVRFNEIFLSCSLDKNDNIFININKLLKEYKKNKDKTLINLTLFFKDLFIKSPKKIKII